MGVPVLNPNPMTVEEFLAFTARRPDNELVEEGPVLNATPEWRHQPVLADLAYFPGAWERERPPAWEALRLADLYRETGLDGI